MMIKKIFVSILSAVLTFSSLGTTAVFAANTNTDRTGNPMGANSSAQIAYADEDEDGICDNREDGTICPQDGTGEKYGQEMGSKEGNNGNGYLSAADSNDHKGLNYADEDEDGICDNRGNGTICPQDGTGEKYGQETSCEKARNSGKGTQNIWNDSNKQSRSCGQNSYQKRKNQ